MSDLLEKNGLKRTLNNRGFMHPMTWPSLAFVAYASESLDPVLDLGCAYGVASIEAIQRGATVYAVDACGDHLRVLEENLAPEKGRHLFTQQALFPFQTNFERGFFGAILMSHILQFLDGDEIMSGFSKIYTWLKPDGRLFISTYTPYYKNLKKYIPIYEAKKREGHPWPGFIEDRHLYRESPLPIQENMPAERIHLFDVHTVSRELEKVGFIIERAEMFGGVERGVPEIFVLDGYEMLGIIARKPSL